MMADLKTNLHLFLETLLEGQQFATLMPLISNL